jgi:hypothetical protein
MTQPPSPRGISRRHALGLGAAAAAAAAGPLAGSGVAQAAGAREVGLGDLDRRLPFSFTYGGVASGTLLPTWRRTSTSRRQPDGRTRRTVTWTDPATALRVAWERDGYPGFPTVSWTLRFTNTGTADSGRLADVLVLDTVLDRLPATGWTIRTGNGSAASTLDFAPYELPLPPGEFRLFCTGGGRPTDGYHNPDLTATIIGGAWPYYNVDMGGAGLIAALGWPGQWAVDVERVDGDSLRLRGGMAVTQDAGPGDRIDAFGLADLWLAPGEHLRTPLVVLQPWNGGDHHDAQNVWRRWMVRHHIPRGAAPLLPTQANDYFPGQTDTARDEIEWITAYRTHGATRTTGGTTDWWWVDAGWYTTDTDWTEVGSWAPDPVRFPDGLEPVVDAARAAGLRSIVWFEPERVMPGTALFAEHPEWLLEPAPGDTQWDGRARLFNFGDEAALAWAIDFYGGIVERAGIDLYREDFNMTPLNYWVHADPPDRRGLTQARYVDGHLRFWEGLVARNPGLLIDTCASGGRRLDVLTLGHAINLLRSDYVLDATGNQAHLHGISSWVPLSGGGVRVTGAADDVYIGRSGMGPSYHEAVQVTDPAAPWDRYAALGAEWASIRSHYLEDYWPLSPHSVADDQWLAWQFGTAAGGFVQAFRRPASTVGRAIYLLRGLDLKRTYEVMDVDAGTTVRRTGRQLATSGLVVTLASAPRATTIRYRRV